ncbi:MAG TPA: MmcQ/YjbR family DNA-binding protein, partial [Saprospiraceae bacterium]|nr:MmcQ/YjbR family DNA-binding protein [Saprospiraceae bacterium]
IEEIRNYCLSKKHTSEGTPFGPEVLVLKVHNKMFALMPLVGDLSINLKCDPEKAIQLREEYPFVIPGYHMNKKLWNTIQLENQNFDSKLLLEWIDDSYDLVYQKLPKKLREMDK